MAWKLTSATSRTDPGRRGGASKTPGPQWLLLVLLLLGCWPDIFCGGGDGLIDFNIICESTSSLEAHYERNIITCTFFTWSEGKLQIDKTEAKRQIIAIHPDLLKHPTCLSRPMPGPVLCLALSCAKPCLVPGRRIPSAVLSQLANSSSSPLIIARSPAFVW